MTASKSLPSHASFESIRKQAKQLVRQFSDEKPEALVRVRAQLPGTILPLPVTPSLSLRDAQFVLAREYGFAGWQDLRSAVLRQEGTGLAWAAAEAERAIHGNNIDRLAQLIREYPALLTWRGDSGETLLDFAAGSFGDAGDAYREERFTRIECAEFLLDAGAIVKPAIWEGAIRARARGVLELLSLKGVLPRNLQVLAALGDTTGVQEYLGAAPARNGKNAAALTEALYCACRFGHRSVAAVILDRLVDLDKALGDRVESWRGRDGFIDYLVEHPQTYGTPWRTVVINEMMSSIDDDSLQEFTRWLHKEPDLLGESQAALQMQLLDHAVLQDRGPFITRLLEMAPTLARSASRTQSSALVLALDYGNSHLIPLLTPFFPLPDDLSHAAGTGDFARVKGWFDVAGEPRLSSLSQHYPTNNPFILGNLHWKPANTQQILDVALAWACVNKRFEIAEFLLERGANINTDWSTHEPASILHECAIHGNYEAAQFLIDHGIDMTIRDYRWNSTAEGWAFYAAGNKEMAAFLAHAEEARKG